MMEGKFLFCLMLLTIPALTIQMCPDGFNEVDGNCFFISDVERNYNDAKEDCQNRGGSLVVIDDAEDREDAMEGSSGPVSYWISRESEDVDFYSEPENYNCYICEAPVPGQTPPPITEETTTPPGYTTVETTTTETTTTEATKNDTIWKPCGQSPNKARKKRVVGGNNAAGGQWPWQVQVRHIGGTFCGGSLISDRWVVTAAHCFFHAQNLSAQSYGDISRDWYFTEGVDVQHLLDPNEDNYIVITGALTLGGGVQRRVERIWIHEKFNFPDNDIALLCLTEVVPDMPICLPPADPGEGTDVYVSGWGSTDCNNGIIANDLQELKTEVIANCGNANMICTYVVPDLDGPHTQWVGDSGGPMQWWNDGCWVLTGVISHIQGSEADCGKVPAVQARVTTFVPWIEKKTGIDTTGC